MSFLKKILVIFHLCVTCSWLFIYLGRPFLGEYFDVRSRLLLYEYVLAIPSAAFTKEEMVWRKQATEELSLEVLEQLNDQYRQLQIYAHRPIWKKMKEGVGFLFVKVPFIELVWIIGSLVVGIGLLKGRAMASQMAWLLPCLILTEVWLFPQNLRQPIDTLMPKESWLLSHYSKQALPPSFARQRQVLEEAWEEFLLKEWSFAPIDSERERRLVSGNLHFQAAKLLQPSLELDSMGAGWLTFAFVSSLFLAYSHQEKRIKQPISAEHFCIF